MANLLHRLLRGRHAPEPVDSQPPAEGLVAEEREPEPEAGPVDEQPPAAAKPKPKARGRRKTRDEVSSIGPGEPV